VIVSKVLFTGREVKMFNGLCHFGSFGTLGAFGTWGWVSIILHSIFWVALIAGIVFLVIWLARQSGSNAARVRVSAREIIQERYARGEISSAEYQDMLKDIS
jgi:putative membrane protein